MSIDPAAEQKTSPQHYPFLDGIRGIAILWVFLFHSLGESYGWNHFPWRGWLRSFDEPRSLVLLFPLSLGGLGVAIFFAVSGFCIHLSHVRNREKGWKYFFHRRFFRINPAYLAAILIFFFLWPWHNYSLYSPTSFKSIIAHLFGVHNLYIHTKFDINPSMWSIGTELQLYAVYPLLLIIMSKFGWGYGLIAMFVFELFIKAIGSGITEDRQSLQMFALSNSPFAFWFSWAIGAYVAQNTIIERRESFKWVDFRVLVLLNFPAVLYKPLAFASFPLIAFATAVAIDRYIAKRWHSINLPFGRTVWNHLTLLGIISYSVYLVHQPILAQAGNLLDKLGLPQNSPVIEMTTCVLLYPLIVILAYGLYRLIEIPFNRLGSNFWRRKRLI